MTDYFVFINTTERHLELGNTMTNAFFISCFKYCIFLFKIPKLAGLTINKCLLNESE